MSPTGSTTPSAARRRRGDRGGVRLPEIETTVPVLADAPSNAVAVTVGAAVASAGVLVQCSVEEAMELEMGIRGWFLRRDGQPVRHRVGVRRRDDTPYSKAILAAGLREPRGQDAGVLRGPAPRSSWAGAEQCSMLYLESRCVSLARALGVQGVQNGGIDGASVAGSVPGGVRELMAENVMVMARNLEACTGNDALMSESDVRRTSRTLPILLAGSDYITSGFGSIQRYDNMFGPSQWNAEDIDDWLAMQRDWAWTWAAHGLPRGDRAAPSRGRGGVPGRVPLAGARRLLRRARRARH
jgi:propanediol dehydratase large subunit